MLKYTVWYRFFSKWKSLPHFFVELFDILCKCVIKVIHPFFLKWQNILGWLVSFGLFITVAYTPFTKNRDGGDPWTSVESAVYEAMSHVVWAVALSWVIFACTQGYGGICMPLNALNLIISKYVNFRFTGTLLWIFLFKHFISEETELLVHYQ